MRGSTLKKILSEQGMSISEIDAASNGSVSDARELREAAE